jgi:hypothetical protein
MFDKAVYWIELCDDDIKVANNLFASKDYLWMGLSAILSPRRHLKPLSQV